MKKLFLFLSLLTAASYLGAQDLSVLSQQTPKEGSFGQPIQLEFSIQHTAGYAVELDQTTLPKDFALTAINTQPQGPDLMNYTVTLLPFHVGEAAFTPLTFQLLDNQKKRAELAQTKPFSIKINPVKFFEDDSFREIRRPHFPSNLWAWFLAAILLLAAIWYVNRWWRRRKLQAHGLVDTADKRPCDEIALSKIEALVGSGLWEQKQYKLFYVTLNDIFREYLWRRFGLDVSADTSAELLRDIKTLPQLSALLPALRRYLNSSDLVKFARAVPPPDAMQADIQTLQKTISATTPKPLSQEAK